MSVATLTPAMTTEAIQIRSPISAGIQQLPRVITDNNDSTARKSRTRADSRSS